MVWRTLHAIFILCWGAWFGGILFLFFSVSALFGTSHSLGASAAPVVFLSFGKYHLSLAGVCLVLCAILMETPPRRTRRWVFMMVLIGCITTLISSLYLTPRINDLHLRGLGHSPEFLRLHGISFGIYSLELLVLFLAGLILAAGPESVAARQKD